MSVREAFDIFVVNDERKGLQDIRVVIVYEKPEFDGETIKTYLADIRGLTNTDGWFGINCNYAFRAEIFLNNKSYGFFWCENGASVSIKM